MKPKYPTGGGLPLLDAIEAAKRGQRGMTRAVDHADRIDPGWSELAFDALQNYASATSEFTAEEARQGIHDAGLALPTDGRAWGAVFKRAAARGLIRKGGYAPRRCGNMTPTIIWRAP